MSIAKRDEVKSTEKILRQLSGGQGLQQGEQSFEDFMSERGVFPDEVLEATKCGLVVSLCRPSPP